MLRFCKQLAVRSLVAFATLGLAVPTLLAAPCGCVHKQADAKKTLPPCCAKRLASQNGAPTAAKSDDCCGGSGPCECPGCKCAIQAPDANTPPAAEKLANPSTHFSPIALSVDFAAISAEQISLAAHTEQTLSRSSPVPLRALYCVWII